MLPFHKRSIFKKHYFTTIIMKAVVVLCAYIASVFCTQSMSQDEQSATAARRALPALVHEEVHDKLGQYSLRYVTAEGTVVMETGELVPTPDGNGLVLASKGEVIYIGDDGKKYVTKYTAGIDGYKVEGEHLPKGPEGSDVPGVPADPDHPAFPAVPLVSVSPSIIDIPNPNA